MDRALSKLLDYLFGAILRGAPKPQAHLPDCSAELAISQQSLNLRALLLIQILQGGFLCRLEITAQRQSKKEATNQKGN